MPSEPSVARTSRPRDLARSETPGTSGPSSHRLTLHGLRTLRYRLYLPRKMSAWAGNSCRKSLSNVARDSDWCRTTAAIHASVTRFPSRCPSISLFRSTGHSWPDRADFSTKGFQQSVDERYGVLNRSGIDEHAVIRDDPQETGNHHGWQNKRAVSSRAGVSGVVEPSCRNDMVFMVGSEMPQPARSHPESPVRRIQQRSIAGAIDAGPQTTAAWRDRQRIHGLATPWYRTQAENQPLLDHGG